MSTLQTRIDALENTTRQAACLDVWDTLKENGIERGLEILRANGVPEHVLAEIEGARTRVPGCANGDARHLARARNLGD
jgi:hypothetical protein